MNRAAPTSTRIDGPGCWQRVGNPSYAALDGWRGICAIFVALLHFRVASHISSLGIVVNAHLFVDFFFVLSGFILSFAYLDRLNSVGDAGAMMWRRLGRLWPLHLAVLAMFVGVELAVTGLAAISGFARGAASAFDPATGASLAAIPSNVLLLQGMGMHERLTWNEPSWSISVEFWTYAVFAIVVLVARRWLGLIAFTIIAGSCLVVVTCSGSYMMLTYDLGFFRCLYGFFAGYLTFRLSRAFPARWSMPTLAEVIAIAVVILFVSYLAGTPAEYAAPIVFAGCVWIFAAEAGRVSQCLKWRPLQMAGVWSYSIYMIHSLVIAVWERGSHFLTTKLFGSKDFQVSGQVFGLYIGDAVTIIYLVVVIALAGLAWRWIEMPAQRVWNGPLWVSFSALIRRENDRAPSAIR